MRYRSNLGALRKLRQEKGLTQAQLAELSGISQGTISVHERSQSDPPASVMMSLADALDMPVQELLDRCFVEIDSEVA